MADAGNFLTLWQWMGTLNSAHATIVGSAIGAVLGFGTLLGGALFNARLNRKRDQAKLDDDALAIAAALKADLTSVANSLIENAAQLKNTTSDIWVRNPAHSMRVISHALDKIGLLDVETITETIQAYTLIDQYLESVLMLGGRLATDTPSNRQAAWFPGTKNKELAALNEVTAEKLRKAILSLEKTLA